jgi:hypothetical protein
VVRASRLEFEDSVYCVIVKTPDIAARFISDPFEAFANMDLPSSPGRPAYLYNLNSRGFPPASFGNRPTVATQESPFVRTQLDSLRTSMEGISQTVHKLILDHKDFVKQLSDAQTSLATTIANVFAIMMANTQLTLAQAESNNLTSSLSTANLLLVMATDDSARAAITNQVTELQHRSAVSTENVARLQHDMHSLRSSLMPHLAAPPTPAPTASPSSRTNPAKRARPHDEADDQSQRQPMEVDDTGGQHVQSPSSFFSRVPELPPPAVNYSLKNHHQTLHQYCRRGVCFIYYFLSVLLRLLLSVFRNNRFRPSVYSPSLFSFSPHLFLFFSVIFLLVTSVSTASAPPLKAVAINANGLADPMKITALNSLVKTVKPHVVVIQETQSTQQVSSRLHFPGYDFHENPGCPTPNRSKGKWGVIVAVRRHLFNIQRVTVPTSLDGRVVALDLTIPLTTGRGFLHRFMGIYAPWNPGTSEDENNQFWPTLTDLCLASNGSWSLAGDCNATLLYTETTTTPYWISTAQQAYANFLRVTGSIDHWLTVPDHCVQSDFTYSLSPNRASPSATPGRSIIDRGASSRVGTAAVMIETLRSFIPCTDHRAILTSTVLIPPPHLNGLSVLPDDIPPSVYAPRFRQPPLSETFRLKQFSTLADSFMEDRPDIPSQISGDGDFQRLHEILSAAFHFAASQSFTSPSRYPRPVKKPTNTTIRLIIKERKRVDRLLSAINRNVVLPTEPFTYSYLNAFYSTHPFPYNTYSYFRDYLRGIRRTLQKISYAEERAERIASQSRSAAARVRNLLHGGSPKPFYPNKLTALPIALVPPPFTDPENLLTGSDNIKAVTIRYFQDLYH